MTKCYKFSPAKRHTSKSRELSVSPLSDQKLLNSEQSDVEQGFHSTRHCGFRTKLLATSPARYVNFLFYFVWSSVHTYLHEVHKFCSFNIESSFNSSRLIRQSKYFLLPKSKFHPYTSSTGSSTVYNKTSFFCIHFNTLYVFISYNLNIVFIIQSPK